MQQKWIRFGLACVLFSLFARSLKAQASASIRGHVTDPSGAAVPEATVKLTRVDTNTSREAKTNDAGFYELLQLAPGNYSMMVTANGFAPMDRANTALLVNLP